MRQKYYRDGNFLNAKKGSNSSMIWKSLWSSIELIEARSVWRVGNGNSIRIWHDRWVSRPVPLKVQSLITILSSDAIVSELIDKEEGYWKKYLISQLFQVDEMELICKIPISIKDAQDKLIWGYIANGRFNVRSTYYLQQTLNKLVK